MGKWVFIAFSFFCLVTNAQQYKPKPLTNNGNFLKTSKDSLSYALGINIARNLQSQGLTNIDAIKLYKGLSDILLKKKPMLTDDQAAQKVTNHVNKSTPPVQPQTQQPQSIRTIPNPPPSNTPTTNKPPKQTSFENPEAAANKELGNKFLQENAKKERVISMPGGWQYYILHQSMDTTKPNIRNTVKCHYHGTLIDGTVFESTYGTTEPAIFPLFRVVKGWQLAITKMTVGSKWKIFLPSHLAYGDRGSSDGTIKPGATLIFDIELLGIEK